MVDYIEQVDALSIVMDEYIDACADMDRTTGVVGDCPRSASSTSCGAFLQPEYILILDLFDHRKHFRINQIIYQHSMYCQQKKDQV